MSTIIGLSFGNTTSSIAYTKEGAVEVIANPDGDRSIPSMLSYAHGDEFHGLQAKHQLVRNAANTVAYFRDYVGVPFEEIDVELSSRSAKPFKGDDGFAAFEIHGERRSVDDIVVRQFARIRDAARDYIGREIDGAVLGLPASTPKAQRTRLVELAGKAGLPITQVVGELSAALLAHISTSGADSLNEDKLYVVSDFGHTRSDAAVISVNGGVFTTLATHTQHGLGGWQLDEAVLNFLANEFKQQHGIDALAEPRAVAKLVLEAETLRKTLSNSKSAQFGIDSLAGGVDFSGSINRLKFEIVARQVFLQFQKFVEVLLANAKVNPLLVDEVVLVGGASWTPKVASVVSQLFDVENTKIVSPSTDTKALPPDELIARGCALQGSLISNLDKDELENLSKHVAGEHLQRSIGVRVNSKVYEILGAHSLVPTKRVKKFGVDEAAKIEIVEFTPEIKTTVHKPEPKPEAEKEEADDDESDWGDSEDEEITVHERVLKVDSVLAEIELKVKSELEVTAFLSSKGLAISARSNGASVEGTVPF